MHAIGCEEAVVNALAEAVLIDRVAEVEVGVAVVVTQGRGGHAELHGRREVVEDDSPRAVIARAATMTLVHDDEVKEVRSKGFEEARTPLVFGKRLVDREVHFATLYDFARFDLIAGITKGSKNTVLRLIDENVAICQVEDLGSPVFSGAVPARGPQLPANLEGDDCFPRPRRHSKENALSSLEDRLDRTLDGDVLVIAFPFSYQVIVGSEESICRGLVSDPTGFLVALPQSSGRRIFRANCLQASEVVEFDKVVTVSRVGEFETEHLGVGLCLLQPIGGRLINSLRLHHSKRKIARVTQQVIHALGRLTDETIAHWDDTTVRNGPLLRNRVQLGIPACGLQLGDDELAAGICFGHVR